MSKHDDFNYYAAFSKQANYALEMVSNLKSAIDAGELGNKDLMDALHTVENDADQVNHDIQAHLVSDFVVPLERSSMGALAHTLDDVSDAVENIAITAYLYNCSEMPKGGVTLIGMIVDACRELAAATDELKGLTKISGNIRKRLIEVQTFESEADRVYIDTVHELYATSDMEPEARSIAHALLDAIEGAMDSVENAAERIEAIIAENI